MMTRLLEVCDQEKVGVAIITSYNDDIIMTDDGLEAVVFTAQGDMRQVRSCATE